MKWTEMSFDTQQATLHNMREYGGHFANALATAWFYADSVNRARLGEAFQDLLDKYNGETYAKKNGNH